MNSKRENGGVEAKMLLFLFCVKVQRLEGRVKERLCDGGQQRWQARVRDLSLLPAETPASALPVFYAAE